MRLSEGPGLLYPLLGTGLPQAPIYVCVWMGVGQGTREARRLPCLPQLLSTILLLLFFVNLTQILTQPGVH